ncbi:MAG: shikimate kinase [Lachnospiraceae bacterium]|nr:shikimate kinase [Lachnospiraceae bacterium]
MKKGRSNIILTGYMGSGKSSAGRLLSKKLKMSFADTDTLIEESQGRSIPQIFGEDGEVYFRSCEHELLKKLAQDEDIKDTVIATGGGIVMDERNRGLLRSLGTVVYLRADAGTLYQRVINDNGRPLLDTDDKFQRIKDMLSVRGPVYEECADIVVDTDVLDKEAVVNCVISAWERRFSDL